MFFKIWFLTVQFYTKFHYMFFFHLEKQNQKEDVIVLHQVKIYQVDECSEIKRTSRSLKLESKCRTPVTFSNYHTKKNNIISKV